MKATREVPWLFMPKFICSTTEINFINNHAQSRVGGAIYVHDFGSLHLDSYKPMLDDEFINHCPHNQSQLSRFISLIKKTTGSALYSGSIESRMYYYIKGL